MATLSIDLDDSTTKNVQNLTAIPYLSLIVFQLTPDNHFSQKIQSLCSYLDYLQANPTLKTTIKIKNIQKYTQKSWKSVAVGGTFDHLHLGHQVLLMYTILKATQQVFIGVTAQQMLKTKKNQQLIQPLWIRMKNVERFVNSIKNGLKIHIFQLKDGYGPTIDIDSIQGLIVSQQTLKGGLKINQIRQKKQMRPLEIVVCQTISIQSQNQLKLSSTHIRQQLLNKNNMDIQMFKNYGIFWEDLIAKLTQQYFCQKQHIYKQKIAQKWKQDIFYRYSQNWRFYHTNLHIFSLIQKFKQKRKALNIQEQIVLQLAIFFHDIVYRPDSNSNEQDSAIISQQFLDQFLGQAQSKLPIKQTVRLLILQTKAHNHPLSILSQIMYDLDMGILTEQQNYKTYAKGIQLQYKPIYKESYRFKRIQFLKKLLTQKTYFSFQAPKLHSNIQWEILALQNNDL